MTEEQAGAAVGVGVLAGMGMTFVLVAFVLGILLIIAHWKMFTKAGEPGWKSIIPIYSDFVLFKLVWDVQNFWIYLGLGCGASLLSNIAQNTQNNILYALASIVAIGALVWYVRLSLNTAKAYGKSTGFGVGLILLPTIFTLILGFGDSRYVGPQR